MGGVRSTCFWDARLQEPTTAGAAEILHPTSAVITIRAGGNERYLDWVRMGVQRKGRMMRMIGQGVGVSGAGAAGAAGVHCGSEREGRVPAARACLPLHHARRRRPRHRRVDHRARLLPVQEKDGRGLRHLDRAARRAAPGRKAKITPTNFSARRKSIAARSKCRCRSRFPACVPRSSRSSCGCRAAQMPACVIRRRSGRRKLRCQRPARAPAAG